MSVVGYSELKELVNSLKYGSRNVVSSNSDYVITRPLNTWDTNYRLYDKREETVYLIDFESVHDSENDLEEYGGVLYQDLVNLEVETIKEVAWRTEKVSYIK